MVSREAAGLMPVNPLVLRWARVTANLSLEAVAQKMKKSTADVAAWESGRASPTYPQLETLAYQVYRRPVAVFFLPAPPEEPRLPQRFRRLPGPWLNEAPSRMRFLIRRVQALQMNLRELHEGTNPAERPILGELAWGATEDAVEVAARTRQRLDISVEEQRHWSSEDAALKEWRRAVTAGGVFVFKESFRSSTPLAEEPRYSGFCLFDADFPVICLNNNDSKRRQIFTLFHELAHLLMGDSGIDALRHDDMERIGGDSVALEAACNRFASHLLAPDPGFDYGAFNASFDDRAVDAVARRYWVSREVILRRLLDRGCITHAAYAERVRLPAIGRSTGRGGDWIATRGAYLGEAYIGAVLSRYERGRITVDEAADYLGTGEANVAKLGDWLVRQTAPSP